MKRVLWMVLLTLALPVAAFAGDVDFSTVNSGTLTGSSAGLSLSEQVTQVSGLTSSILSGSNLATIAFNTGALTSVSSTQWSFASGGSFTITAENIPGIANGTTIFTGTFSCVGGCTFTQYALGSNGMYTYVVNGTINGTWYNGTTVNGFTMQATVATGMSSFDGSATVASGDTYITTTPEPGSLMLMGTGLVGLGGALRRKLKA